MIRIPGVISICAMCWIALPGGCLPSGVPPVTKTTTTTVTWPSDEQHSLGGVGHACLLINVYHHGESRKTALVIWTPFDPRIGFGSGSDAGGRSDEFVETGAVWNSGAENVERTKVEYEIHFEKGATGWIELGEKRYALHEGSIFLVGFGDAKTYVKQVHLRMPEFPAAEEEWEALAMSDDEIRRFFERLSAPNDRSVE